MAVAAPVRNGAPVGEIAVANPNAIPSWLGYGKAIIGVQVDREYVPELRFPTSIRTYERMSNDTQLSGLMNATTLPIRRYVWGINGNGARPEIIAAVCRDFNLPLIEDAWRDFQTGESAAVPRERGLFRLDKHLEDALKALRFGHFFFELVGEIGDDGFWHPVKLGPIANWTVEFMQVARNGDLISLKQRIGFDEPDLLAPRLLPYVCEKDAGEWHGKSKFRSCYREWLLKDLLLRVDAQNHEKAGGILINEAPVGALPAEIEKLAALAANFRVGGGAAVPAGTTPIFIRGSGSDVIGSINRHDEAMSREFLAMFMSLGTASSGGNRALSGSFIDWFSIGQETQAIWAAGSFNDGAITPYVNWNWGDQEDYVPKLVFRRPETANPLDTLADGANSGADSAEPVALALRHPDGRIETLVSGRRGIRNSLAFVLPEETRWAVNEAHAERERDISPARFRQKSSAARAATPLPDGPFRRDLFEHEVRAAVDFAQINRNWQQQADSLVAQWKAAVRAAQIQELHDLIAGADGDLPTLAQVTASAAGDELIAGHLTTMAQLGAAEALAEAKRQGLAAATAPDLTGVAPEITARAAAVAQLLANSLSQAAANKAVQLTGGALASADVAAATVDYINGFSDTYLSDQFGGALSAAQNAGRVAVMQENKPTSIYASELLDSSCCQPCQDEDGTEFSTIEDATAAYPSGGFSGCLGGPRCRGTLISVYGEAEPSA